MSRARRLASDCGVRLAGLARAGAALVPLRVLQRLRRDADEEAALRRVADLVGRAVSPEDVFAMVAAESGRLLRADACVVSRYEADGAVRVVGAWTATGAAGPLPTGTREEPDRLPVHRAVFDTGGPVRRDDLGEHDGSDLAAHWGIRSAVGVPVRLTGRIWGVIVVASGADHRLPPDTEIRLARFTELLAAAMATAEARRELRGYAEEQAALRRVATIVARAAAPEEAFAAVAAEVARLLQTDFAVMSRYDADGATVVGSWPTTGWPRALPVGLRLEHGGRNVHTMVFETGQPARIDDYSRDTSGLEAEVARKYGCTSVVGVPIRIEGRLWGGMFVASRAEQGLPADIEDWLVGFAELVATAIANAQARVELRRHAEEQAALRRVAVLVARAVPSETVFAAVAAEVGRLLDVDAMIVSRYDGAGTATVVGAWTADGAGEFSGTRVEHREGSVHRLVFQTGRPARRDGDEGATNVGREFGIRSAVGVPISVDGRLWGVMIAGSRRDEPLPPGTEAGLAGFTELVATAIANAQARVELRGYAEEQAALRRAAVLVARAAPPEEIFAAVAAEVGQLLQIDYTVLSRYDEDGGFEVLADWSRDPDHEPGWVGTRFELGGRNIPTLVFETARPARIDDYGEISGPVSAPVRVRGFRSGVGAPISVGARLWGVMVAASTAGEPLPAGIEGRLAAFTELIGTALANADAQAALTASRARIVAAADTARRRIERDLHDGAQQRLVSLQLQAVQIQAALPPELADQAAALGDLGRGLEAALEELQELARGIHPAALARRGLQPALRTLADRSPVPVRTTVEVDGRLAEPIELAAYYVVAEALTNAAKHADATVIAVDVTTAGDALTICVRDDGRGRADIGAGSGLLGLNDRVEALGGRMTLDSPPGKGTTLEIVLPLS